MLKKLLPPIKQKQLEIQTWIYKFRFLNRYHIQTLLNHKHRQKIILWLNDLVVKKYLKAYSSKTLPRVPTIYSLGTMGRKYFLEHPEITDINISLLDRVWKEPTNSLKFRKHCMFLAEIYISLVSLVKKIDSGKGKLTFFSNTDLKGVEHLIYPEPDAYFFIEDSNSFTSRYFIEIIDEYERIDLVKRRVESYFRYYKKGYWQNNMKIEFPEIIIVCPHNTYKEKLNNLVKKILNTKGKNILFYLSTWEEIKKEGMNEQVLHKVE